MKSLTHLKCTLIKILAASTIAVCAASTAQADGPGHGATAVFETWYLKMMIDHHFSALRMTELAAGTELHPTSAISPDDRVHPTPGFPATEPRAVLDDVKSLSRTNNRMQREEILVAQQYLKEWYGITYEPRLTTQGRQDIEKLESAQGASFDKAFIVTMSKHHYMAAATSLDCLVARDLSHSDLRRYCQNILDAQVSDIDHMRHLACEEYNLCDLQPQRGSRHYRHGRK